jgi:sugar/nucleoside kinase (ribokinase family)
MDCTVVGDIFFDVMIRKDPSKLGLIRGGTSYSEPILMEHGGMGNVAIGLSKLGGKAQFIGKAGKDALGSFYQKDLTRGGVRAEIVFDKSHPTGIIITFVDKKGERSFLISRGANDFLLPEEVEQYENDIAESEYLFVSGYSLINLPQREAILKAAKLAKLNGVKVIFDPGSHNLIRQRRTVFNKLISLCDVIVPNLEEAKALTNSDRVIDVGRHLSKRVPLIALKMGREGCMLITRDKRIKCQGNWVNCVDSTGAGDAYASALIYGLTKDLPLEKTARLANWYASCNIQKLGPRSFPNKEEITNYFSSLIT